MSTINGRLKKVPSTESYFCEKLLFRGRMELSEDALVKWCKRQVDKRLCKEDFPLKNAGATFLMPR